MTPPPDRPREPLEESAKLRAMIQRPYDHVWTGNVTKALDALDARIASLAAERDGAVGLLHAQEARLWAVRQMRSYADLSIDWIASGEYGAVLTLSHEAAESVAGRGATVAEAIADAACASSEAPQYLKAVAAFLARAPAATNAQGDGT